MSEPSVFLVVRGLHIAAGTLALFVGPGAMLVRKGGRWHRVWGKIYVGAMAGVALTAVLMSLWKDNRFLLAIAVFSFYLAFSGWRTLKRGRGANAKPGLPLPDLVVAVGGLGAGGWLVTAGVRTIVVGNWFGTTLVAFGIVAIVLSSVELRDVFRVRAKGKWLGQHIGRMLGAYTATLTAFSAVNFHFVPMLVAWLWPTAMMAPLIALTIRHWRKPRPQIPVVINHENVSI